MTQQLSDRQHGPLCRRVHRRICWMLNDVKGVEENPQRMRRIYEPPVGKRIAREQVTKLIVYFRLRHRHPREQRQAGNNRGRTDRNERGPFISREMGKLFLDQTEIGLAQSWLWQSQPETNRKNYPI